MAKDSYIEQIFPIQCKGRNRFGKEVLKEPVKVEILIYQSPGDEKNILFNVKCRYNTGGHGQRCKASHPKVDKEGEGVICPYSVDIPYAIDNIDLLQNKHS